VRLSSRGNGAQANVCQNVLDDDSCPWNRRLWYRRYSRSPAALSSTELYLGEYPASSTSASEAANQHSLKSRGPVFILVTNLPLSFGTPLAVSIFLIVFSACHQSHYSTVWRVCFGLGCLLPLSVFYFRIRMLNSVLYRRGAIKRDVPYKLVLRYY
jgi:hypothetical protein